MRLPSLGHLGRLGGLLAVYAVVLHYVYQYKIAPVFSYVGDRYREPNWISYALVLLLALAVSAAMPRRISRPSDFILWVLYVMVVVPTLLVPQYADIVSTAQATRLALVVSGLFLGIVGGAYLGPYVGAMIPRVTAPPALVWLAVIGVTVLTYGWYMLFTTGLSIRFVSLGDVRDLRFGYRDVLAVHGHALAYMIFLQSGVINPTIMARGIYSRRWALFGIGAFLQLPIFSVTGYKMTLLSIPAMIAVGFLFRLRPRPKGIMILLGVVATGVLSLIADLVLSTGLYSKVFVHRLSLTPGVLSAAYVKVFEEAPKAHWGYSFLSPFVEYPYDRPPAFIVGAAFANSPENSANANLFADGYANYGYTGSAIEAAALVVLLWLIDASARRLPVAVSSLILLVPTISLVNTSVFTSILTNGLAGAILLMAVLPRTGWGLPARARAPTDDLDAGPAP